MKTILIVEDEENLLRGLAFSFEKDGYTVVTAMTIRSALSSFADQKIDLVILDLGLPDGSGMELCRKMRETSQVPLIMLTACDLETDEVAGLLAGADDYMTKPFSLSVLRARVKALFRRLGTKEEAAIHSGQYRLDTAQCKLYRSNKEIPISLTEFRLLSYLMSNAGQILSKEQILAALWDNQGNFVDENTLSVNISRLRAKVEEHPKKPERIKTIHGLGYLWVKE